MCKDSAIKGDPTALLQSPAIEPDCALFGRKARSWQSYIVFSICTSLYLVPFMHFALLYTDEGILLCGAERIAHGQVFARDFFEGVGPGTFYWLALFFKLFGVSFASARICLFISTFGTAISMYDLARRLCTRFATLACLLLVGTLFPFSWLK